ncbi:MAG: insulinase family protein, partial [bacterium]
MYNKINNNNFEILNVEEIKNIGTGYILRHLKSRAIVVYIGNQDSNKVFSICFKTLPKDNTGVFHILEHCILAGSNKYPLKEPFNQLDKCTINTYLNAITFSDKTLYPIGSTNAEDFFKLTDVYLDAVFFPLISTQNKKGIFLQEGWHIDEDNNINGIVYNEMKGVYSTPDVLMDFKVKQKLFEGSGGYEFDSGGYPDNITDLDYDDFISTYNSYYTPSNSVIYLYGDLDIDFYLDYLHADYLSKFDYKEKTQEDSISSISKKDVCQEKPTELHDFYNLDDIDSEEELKELQLDLDLNYIQASFKLDCSLDDINQEAFDILADILTENNEGILKNALINAGICQDVTSYIDDEMLIPTFNIIIEGTKEKDLKNFKKILFNTINSLVINQDLVESAISTKKFYFKEKDFGYKPEGLFYNIRLLTSLLHGKLDFTSLNFDYITNSLKSVDYKALLIKNIIYNNNAVYCILKPSFNNVNAKNNSLKFIQSDLNKLRAYQSEVDSEENLKKIPALKIHQIPKQNISLDTQVDYYKDCPIIYNCINSDIIYLNLIFTISNGLKALNLNKYISLYIYMLNKLDTKKFKSHDLESKINLLLGNLEINNTYVSKPNNTFTEVVAINMSMLDKNIKPALDVVVELLKNTILDKSKIKKLLLEYEYKIKLDVQKDPKTYAVIKAKSYISSKGSYIESIEGISFYNWLKSLNKSLEADDNLNELVRILEFIKLNLLNLNNCYFGVACSEAIFNTLDFSFFEVLNSDIATNSSDIDFIKNLNIDISTNNSNTNNQAFIISSDVNYNTQVAYLGDSTNFKYKGSLSILSQMINNNYLWEKIRTEGGAYGGTIDISIDGLVTLSSYRDPNLIKTYTNFNNIASYIKDLSISEDELHLYKIGVINQLDKPIKNYFINNMALNRYFYGITEDDLNVRRLEVLDSN